VKRTPIISWALYDFANTIFSANIVAIYVPLWVTQELVGKDIHYSLALSASMLAVALTMPVLGALSDRWGKRKPLLLLFTVVCACATGGLGAWSTLPLALCCFAVANSAYHGGLVFYNALLPAITGEETRGRVIGSGCRVWLSRGHLRGDPGHPLCHRGAVALGCPLSLGGWECGRLSSYSHSLPHLFPPALCVGQG
jgi:MFS-type transporter involved in bile tolerance (Atg22 family)